MEIPVTSVKKLAPGFERLIIPILIKFAKKNMGKFSEYTHNKSVSKGGIIGGLFGAIASTRTYSPTDSTLKKAGKTGLFAAAGYLIGDLIEKLFKRK